MLDGFFTGSRFKVDKTDKQSLELRIKDSVLNMVIDRDQSFLKTARKGKTSIIVNNRSGGIQEFEHNGRRYISFPSSMEKDFDGLSEEESEKKMDELIRLVTTSTRLDYEENQMNDLLTDKENEYTKYVGQPTGFKPEIDAVTGEITNNPFEYRASKSDKDNKDDVEEGEDGSSGSKDIQSKGMGNPATASGMQKVEITSKNMKDSEFKFTDTDLSIDGQVPKEVKNNPFFSEDDSYYEMDKHREEQLRAIAKNIVKSFKGRVSKNKTMIPSKRLISKSLVRDDIDKIYSNKKGENGKHLNINLVFDMSGSMSGEPVKNAMEIAYIFNEIASSGYLTGSVLWSESSSRCKTDFPMPREFIKKMKRTGGGEGLGRNLGAYKSLLKKSDANICMTDGQLTDEPILKEMYSKEKIQIIGVYVNKGAKDLTEYTGSLNRWFTHSLVRNTTEELCEKLIQFSLRKKRA